jgi:hypothetical protein
MISLAAPEMLRSLLGVEEARAPLTEEKEETGMKGLDNSASLILPTH